MEIAKTILQQLGGAGRLQLMTGANTFVALKNGVTFKIKNRKVNFVKITLNGKDLYDVYFYKLTSANLKLISEHNDIYFDELIPLFEKETGMYLTLYAKGGRIKKDERTEMILSQLKQIHHHEKELQEIIKKDKSIEPWVIAKMQRAVTDLGDVTHYEDGKVNVKMAKGGVIKNISKQLDELGVKYTLSKSKVRLFDEIIKPVDKDDNFYNKFDRIIDLYNLEGVVKTKMAKGGYLENEEVEHYKNRLLATGERSGYLDTKDLNNPKIQQLAEDEAEEIVSYLEDAEEFGSSDFASFFRSFILNAKGIDIWKKTFSKGGSILNEYEQEEFDKWKEDGNVSKNADGTYSTQDAQFRNSLKNLTELKKYFKKEFFSDTYYAKGGEVKVNGLTKQDYIDAYNKRVENIIENLKQKGEYDSENFDLLYEVDKEGGFTEIEEVGAWLEADKYYLINYLETLEIFDGKQTPVLKILSNLYFGKPMKIGFDFITSGDVYENYTDELDKIKILSNKIDFDEVNGSINYDNTENNTNLEFYKNGELVMSLKGDYNTDTDELDAIIDIDGETIELNYHPRDSMGGISYEQLEENINEAFRELNTYSAVVSIEGYEEYAEDVEGLENAKNVIQDIKGNTRFQVLKGSRVGIGKRVDNSRVVAEYEKGGEVGEYEIGDFVLASHITSNPREEIPFIVTDISNNKYEIKNVEGDVYDVEEWSLSPSTENEFEEYYENEGYSTSSIIAFLSSNQKFAKGGNIYKYLIGTNFKYLGELHVIKKIENYDNYTVLVTTKNRRFRLEMLEEQGVKFAEKPPRKKRQPLTPEQLKYKNAQKIRELQWERKNLLIDMEQEAEPEGGPIANRYGRMLNNIDKRIAKLSGQDYFSRGGGLNSRFSSSEKWWNSLSINARNKIIEDNDLQYASTNDYDGLTTRGENEVDNIFNEINEPQFKKGGMTKCYADGGEIEIETPRVYIEDYDSAYSGKSFGQWLELSKFKTGQDVMDKISDIATDWSKRKGEKIETISVTDYENIPRSLAHEWMSSKDYDFLVKAYEVAKMKRIPLWVIGDVLSDYSDSFEHTKEGMIEFIDDNYLGYANSDSDLAYDYIEKNGGIKSLAEQMVKRNFDYDKYGRDTRLSMSEEEERKLGYTKLDDFDLGKELVEQYSDIRELPENVLKSNFNYRLFGDYLTSFYSNYGGYYFRN